MLKLLMSQTRNSSFEISRNIRHKLNNDEVQMKPERGGRDNRLNFHSYSSLKKEDKPMLPQIHERDGKGWCKRWYGVVSFKA